MYTYVELHLGSLYLLPDHTIRVKKKKKDPSLLLQISPERMLEVKKTHPMTLAALLITFCT